MNHQQFKQTYLNTFVEKVDPNSPYQCMDLAIAYCEEVLGTPRTIFSGLMYAYEVFEKPTKNTGSAFDFVINTPWSVPKQGDVLVFKKAINGTAGHIVIVDTADMNTVTVISQNDPVGSKVIMKTYPYTFVLGWLRKIEQAITGVGVSQLQQQVNDLKETEKRLTDEKDQIVKTSEARIRQLLAEQALNRQQARKEIIDRIMKFTETL